MARKAKDAKARPGIDEIAQMVIRVFERHGFKGDRLLLRYKRGDRDARAFALRKDCATCWTNLKSEDGPKPASSAADKAAKPAVWRLAVDCFLG